VNLGSLVVQPNHLLTNKSTQNKRDAKCTAGCDGLHVVW